MATKKVVVEGSSVTASQLSELFRQINDGSIGGRHMDAFLEHRHPFEGTLSRRQIRKKVFEQCQFLQKYFGILLDDREVRDQIPPHQEGFDRLIIVFGTLTIEDVYAVFEERFKMLRWTNDDLDNVVTENDREVSGDNLYAIWVRDYQEAEEEENKNLSANDLREQGHVGETLLERLLHELAYYEETGKHLDVKNVTLCTGSRYSNGYVPSVGFDSDAGTVCVYGVVPTCRRGSVRSRSVKQ